MAEPKSDGERQLAGYLDRLGLVYEHEALVGTRRPDFLVQYAGGPVVLEVYEPELKLPRGRIFHFDSAPDLREVYSGRKKNQAQAAKTAGIPFFFVFGEAKSEIPLDPLVMAGAMFGAVSVQFPVWLGEGEPPPAQSAKTVFGQGGRLQPEINTSVSGIAILRSFNPTLHLLQDLYRPRLAGVPDGDVDALLDVLLAAEDEAIATGIFDPEAISDRLIVLHNPYAEFALEVGTFTGPYDEEWGLSGDEYTRVAVGPAHHQLPR